MKYKITFFRTLTGESGDMDDVLSGETAKDLTLDQAVKLKEALEKTMGTFAMFSIVEDK